MLSRRIVGPRDVVMAWDPAIDAEASDIVAYQEALWDFDAGHMKVKPGEKATIWRIGPLEEGQKRRAKAMEAGSPEWSDYVFACCCHGVRNYVVYNDGGAETELQMPERKDQGAGEMLPMDWVRSSKINLDDVQAVALIGWQLSEARGPLSKPSRQPAGG